MRYYSMALQLLCKRKQSTLCYLFILTITMVLMVLFGNLLTHPYFAFDGNESILRKIVLSISTVFLCALTVNYYCYSLFINFQRDHLTILSLCGATNYQLRSIVRKQMILLYAGSLILGVLLSNGLWNPFYDWICRVILETDLPAHTIRLQTIISLIVLTVSTFVFAILLTVSKIENLPVNYLTVNEPFSGVLSKNNRIITAGSPIWAILLIVSVCLLSYETDSFYTIFIIMLVIFFCTRQMHYYLLEYLTDKQIIQSERIQCGMIALSFVRFELRKSIFLTAMMIVATGIFRYSSIYLDNRFYHMSVLLFLIGVMTIILGEILNYFINMNMKAESIAQLAYLNIKKKTMIRSIQLEIILFYLLWIALPLIVIFGILMRDLLHQVLPFYEMIWILLIILLTVCVAAIVNYWLYKKRLFHKLKEIRDE